jgi:serine/threonine protein kinase
MGAGDSARSTLSDRGDADANSAAPLRPGLLLAGRYEVVALLGKGASAGVYRVYDRIAEQHVAVKALDPEKSASTTWVERLARELRHARASSTPTCAGSTTSSSGRAAASSPWSSHPEERSVRG